MGRLHVVLGRRPVLALHWPQHTPEDSAAQPPRSLSTPPERALPISHVGHIPRVIHLTGLSFLHHFFSVLHVAHLHACQTDALRGQ